MNIRAFSLRLYHFVYYFLLTRRFATRASPSRLQGSKEKTEKGTESTSTQTRRLRRSGSVWREQQQLRVRSTRDGTHWRVHHLTSNPPLRRLPLCILSVPPHEQLPPTNETERRNLIRLTIRVTRHSTLRSSTPRLRFKIRRITTKT